MIIKRHLLKIETADNDNLFLLIDNLLRKVQQKHPDYLEVVEVDKSNKIILFISTSYIGANVLRILMEQKQQFPWHNDEEEEDSVKVERLPYKFDG
jgi:arginyl-tRNA synthetase